MTSFPLRIELAEVLGVTYVDAPQAGARFQADGGLGTLGVPRIYVAINHERAEAVVPRPNRRAQEAAPQFHPGGNPHRGPKHGDAPRQEHRSAPIVAGPIEGPLQRGTVVGRAVAANAEVAGLIDGVSSPRLTFWRKMANS